MFISGLASLVYIVYSKSHMSFAIIETGGKQYRVSAGAKIKIEKIEGEANSSVAFDKVLLTSDGANLEIGAPYLLGAKVEGKILRQGRARKVIVFKFHSKTRQHKTKGHRQSFTEVEIAKI